MLLTSKYDGWCRACRGNFSVGDPIAWDPQTRLTYHPDCAPPGMAEPPRGGGRPRARATGYSPEAAKDKAQEAALQALVALEAAIFLRTDQVSAEELTKLEAIWTRYQKAKALALQPGTDGEGRAAIRLALIEAIKLTF